MEAVRRFGETIATLSATVVSDDHAVSVTVGPGGAITELTLTDRARHLDGMALGRTIVETIDRATVALNELLVAEIAEIPGANPNLAAIVAGRLPEVPSLAPAADWVEE